MAPRVRIAASQGVPGRGPVPPLIYRAEAYDDQDQFREAVWTCDHEHGTVEDALHCGARWLEERETA